MNTKRQIYRKAIELITSGGFSYSCQAVQFAHPSYSSVFVNEYSSWGRLVVNRILSAKGKENITHEAWLIVGARRVSGDPHPASVKLVRIRILKALAAGHKARAERILTRFIETGES